MGRTMAAKAVYDLLYDSHCHLREVAIPSAERSAAVASSPSAHHEVQPSLTSLVLCGTHPQIDWNLVQEVLTKSTSTKPISGFGVHPWFAPHLNSENDKNNDTEEVTAVSARSGCCCEAPNILPQKLTMSLAEILTDLEQRLRNYPRAIVAEIGLDKLRGPPESVQRDTFVAQLRVAAAYQRPVSVHCVRHYGLLLQILQELPAEETPPAIIVHAFTGSMEVAKSLLNLKNKKRTPPSPAVGKSADKTVIDGTTATGATPALQRQQEKKTKHSGVGTSADTVRIKERLFFGVGLSTSFTVKNFATQTLPFLLSAQRVLPETDAHYGAERGWGSTGNKAECNAEACVYVDEREHAVQLTEVMHAVEAAASQNAEFVKAAQEAGTAPDVLTRKYVAAAYANAFCTVLS